MSSSTATKRAITVAALRLDGDGICRSLGAGG
jgi:hypothetical protein